VSIILPTFNRAKFLPQAFASIRSQTFTDWELIVVDDGSTDETPDLVTELTRGWEQPVRYHRQENQGAYGARNTGLDLARGEYIAFFDSDDVWLPDFLARLASGLRDHQEIDWTYCATRIVELPTGREVAPSSFQTLGQPQPFLQLPTKPVGNFRVFSGREVLAEVLKRRMGLFCGLQNSVIRRSVFERLRFRTHLRDESEDVLTALRALCHGCRFGYVEAVLVQDPLHTENSSAAAVGCTFDKRLRLCQAALASLRGLASDLPLSSTERAALVQAVSDMQFWDLGYAVYWQNGRKSEALAEFSAALRRWPWRLRCWKTYLGCLIRTYVWSHRSSGANRTGRLP